MKVSCNLHVAFTCSLSSHKVIANLHCIGKKQSKQSYCSFQVEIWTLSYNNNYFCLDSFDTCNCIFTFVNFTSYNQIKGVFYQMHNILQLFGYKAHSAIGRSPNSATSLLHVFKLKISLKYLVIRRTVVWGVKIGQVYCKFFHKLTKKRKSGVLILIYH